MSEKQSKLEQMQQIVNLMEIQEQTLTEQLEDMPTEFKDALIYTYKALVAQYKFLVRLYASGYIKKETRK